MSNSDPAQSGAPAGNNEEVSKDQEMTDEGKKNAGGEKDRDEGNKAAGEREEGTGTPEGQVGNNMNSGTGGLTADNFNILLSLRLARPPDDSPTKVIAEFFQVLLQAEPNAHITPQMK